MERDTFQSPLTQMNLRMCPLISEKPGYSFHWPRLTDLFPLYLIWLQCCALFLFSDRDFSFILWCVEHTFRPSIFLTLLLFSLTVSQFLQPLLPFPLTQRGGKEHIIHSCQGPCGVFTQAVLYALHTANISLCYVPHVECKIQLLWRLLLSCYSLHVREGFRYKICPAG